MRQRTFKREEDDDCTYLPHPRLMTTFFLFEARVRNSRTITSMALSLNQ